MTTKEKRGYLKSDQRRQQILATVSRFVLRRGEAGFTVADVVQQLGITRSLFYHYFPSKDAAIAIAIQTRAESLITKLRLRANDPRSPEEIVDSVSRLIVALARESPGDANEQWAPSDPVAYAQLVHEVASIVAEDSMQATERDSELRTAYNLTHPYETMYMLVSGLTLCLVTRPYLSETTVRDVVRDTLALDRK